MIIVIIVRIVIIVAIAIIVTIVIIVIVIIVIIDVGVALHRLQVVLQQAAVLESQGRRDLQRPHQLIELRVLVRDDLLGGATRLTLLV